MNPLEFVEQISPDVEECQRCRDLGMDPNIPPGVGHWILTDGLKSLTMCQHHFELLVREVEEAK